VWTRGGVNGTRPTARFWQQEAVRLFFFFLFFFLKSQMDTSDEAIRQRMGRARCPRIPG
jgi:hypothetical protein